MKNAVQKAVQTPAASQDMGVRRMHPMVKKFRRDWQMHLMFLIPFAYIVIFQYIPIYGAQIAFRSYDLKLGFFDSEWVGLHWMEKFVAMPNFWQIVGNTFWLSMYMDVVGFPLPIIFALLINVVRNAMWKRTIQTISYLPHFISTVIMVAILNQVLSPVTGIYGYFYRLFGNIGYPDDIRALPSAFYHLYVWSGQWQGLGWSTIIYLSALGSVSLELHEAAQIDGASRWKRVLNIDLPTILPTCGILLILRVGSLLGVGFQKVHLMQNTLNLTKSEVISTYVYKKGLGGTNADQSYGTAVGMMNNVVNAIMLILVNWVSRKASHDEVALF